MRPVSTTPTALVLIDIQEGFKHPTHWGESRSTPEFELNVEKILGAFREYNDTTRSDQSPERLPALIIHVHHHSTSPASALHPSHYLEESSTPSVAPLSFAAPVASEPVVIKNFNSAFVKTQLESMLRAVGIRQLVLVGLTTDHCVSTTTRMAANLQVLGDDGGPDGNGHGVHGVVLVRDAIATFERGGYAGETVHAVHLASLEGEFAEVVSADSVLTMLGQGPSC
ncbi:isochorismatase hydrolase [Colletotrichum tabaci]|uniref:Isochorismatase hydrolase n=1 Tax=Colletotrichum tabaci TaxID=1209068 RepID=A0AAV9SWI9_9PEZI